MRGHGIEIQVGKDIGFQTGFSFGEFFGFEPMLHGPAFRASVGEVKAVRKGFDHSTLRGFHRGKG